MTILKMLSRACQEGGGGICVDLMSQQGSGPQEKRDSTGTFTERELEAAYNALVDRLMVEEQAVAAFKGKLVVLEPQIAHLGKLEEYTRDLQQYADGLSKEVARLQQQLKEAEQAREGAAAELLSLRGSLSWKITLPLRLLGSGVARLREMQGRKGKLK